MNQLGIRNLINHVPYTSFLYIEITMLIIIFVFLITLRFCCESNKIDFAAFVDFSTRYSHAKNCNCLSSKGQRYLYVFLHLSLLTGTYTNIDLSTSHWNIYFSMHKQILWRNVTIHTNYSLYIAKLYRVIRYAGYRNNYRLHMFVKYDC